MNTPHVIPIKNHQVENWSRLSKRGSSRERRRPQPIVFQPAIKDQDIYDLYAVCNHHGTDLQGGHYTASCRNPVNGEWYSFDDTHVTQVHEKDLITSSAYLLFYQRRTLASNTPNYSHWSLKLPELRRPLSRRSSVSRGSKSSTDSCTSRRNSISNKKILASQEHLADINGDWLRHDAKEAELKNDYSGRMHKKAAVLSKTEKMGGSKQVDPFEKLHKEIVVIAEKLSMFYRSPALKKSFKLRRAIMDSIRHTNSLMEKFKTYQNQTLKRNSKGIISSFSFQIAKLNSSIVNLEKDLEKMQKVECAAITTRDNLLQYGTKLCSRKEPSANLRTDNSTEEPEINWRELCLVWNSLVREHYGYARLL
ncbi:ubiquitin carboxyl-terminal hydrolase 36-like [Artemia franciscana]|uniref:ubiquitin carboxyl-terminal hydrolase 36-like n=1 Tax=Artemia franciscana TaxID=6661 RepID=UPI0032DB58BE